MRKLTESDLRRGRWLRGRLSYKLHPGQKLIREAYDNSKNQLFVGKCARQFGKTVFEVIIALEKAFSKPKAKVKIGTAFHTDLVEFLLPAFDFVLGDCPKDLLPIWKKQSSKFVLPHNLSEIKLIGLDRKPNGLRGTVIDLIILSEAAFIGKLHYLFRSVIVPATTHRPDCRIVMLSTPPDTPAHEFLDYVQKAKLEGGYIVLNIYQNPMLTSETIQRLMYEAGGERSTTWRREYLCEDVTDQDLAIIPDWKNEYVQEIPRDSYYPFYHRYIAMDLGVVHDHTAVIFGYYDFLRAKLIIEDEFVLRGPDLTTAILQAHIKRKELEIWGNNSEFSDLSGKLEDPVITRINQAWHLSKPKVHIKVSDNNNPLLLQDLSILHNLHFTPTDKGRIEEMVNTLRILVNSGGLSVHPRCKQVGGCLEYGVWERKREKFDRSELFGHYDALAALIYLVRNLSRTINPIPANHGFDQDNQILFQRKRESPNVKVLKNAFGFKG